MALPRSWAEKGVGVRVCANNKRQLLKKAGPKEKMPAVREVAG